MTQEVTMSRPGLVFLVLAFLGLPVALPTPADAVSINISIGTNLSGGRSISCAEGARRVRDRGFSQRPICRLQRQVLCLPRLARQPAVRDCGAPKQWPCRRCNTRRQALVGGQRREVLEDA